MLSDAHPSVYQCLSDTPTGIQPITGEQALQPCRRTFWLYSADRHRAWGPGQTCLDRIASSGWDAEGHNLANSKTFSLAGVYLIEATEIYTNAWLDPKRHGFRDAIGCLESSGIDHGWMAYGASTR